MVEFLVVLKSGDSRKKLSDLGGFPMLAQPGFQGIDEHFAVLRFRT